MPKIGNITLPTVTLSGQDPADVAALLKDKNMPLEAMVEVAIYCKREREKAEALAPIEDLMRARLKKAYAAMPPEKRVTTRTEVGMLTYTAEAETITLKDRDKTVEMLTDEQIRITYKPDLKALKTIMKPAEFNRHVTRGKSDPKITLRDNRASDEYSELDDF